MNLNILAELNESVTLSKLKGATDEKIKNAFFANYLSALILLRLQDLKGLMLINDPAHAKLSKFSANMSDLNFWARALFYPMTTDVKNRLAHGHAQILAHDSGRILDARIQKIMKVPLTNPAQVDWDDTVSALLLLKHRYELQSTYFNNITYALHKWNNIRDTEKTRAINQAFMYLMQSDPHSNLISRIRSLSGSSMINGIADIAQKIIGFRKLNEDGEGGGDAGGEVSTSEIATKDNAIIGGRPITQNSIEAALGNAYTLKKPSLIQLGKRGKYMFKDGKIIKKRKKNFEPKIFKAPTGLFKFKK